MYLHINTQKYTRAPLPPPPPNTHIHKYSTYTSTNIRTHR